MLIVCANLSNLLAWLEVATREKEIAIQSRIWVPNAAA